MGHAHITIEGYLGQDPRVHVLAEGTDNERSFVTASVAVNRRWTNSAGQRVEHTSWFDVVAGGPLAERLSDRVKGEHVLIAGTPELVTHEEASEALPYRVDRLRIRMSDISYLDTKAQRQELVASREETPEDTQADAQAAESEEVPAEV